MYNFSKSLYILIVFGLLLLACNSKNKRIERIGNKHITINMQLQDSIPINDIDTTINIIRKRLTNHGIPKESIVISNSINTIYIDINHADNPERIIYLATSIGKFAFWETYNIEEIYPNLVRADKILKDSFFIAEDYKIKKKQKIPNSNNEGTSLIEKSKTKIESDKEDVSKLNPLFAYLQPSIKDDISGNPVLIPGPEVGYCKIADTSIINNMFSKKYIKSLFPRDLYFAWNKEPQQFDSTLIGLIALRYSNQFKEPLLTSEYITEAIQTSSKGGRIEISIRMSSQGAKIWKEITSRLSKKQEYIAILIDGYVYSYPKVISEIQNGNTTILGNFSETEAEDIATIIKYHQLPIVVKTIESKIINE